MSCEIATGSTISTNGADVAVLPAGTIAAEAIAVEVGEGESDILGNVLEFLPVFTVHETYRPTNCDFENGSLSPWTVGPMEGVEKPETTSGVKSNGSAFDTKGDDVWTTPDTSHYLMLRRGCRASTNIDIPTDGKWRIRYLCGCRPGENLSLDITVNMKVDDAIVHVMEPLTAVADLFPFTEFVTAPFALDAGEHVFAIENHGNRYNGSLNYDLIRFERVTESHGTFTKTGAGTLAPAAQQPFTNVLVNVSAGELTLSGMMFANAAVNVANGGAVSLSQPNFSGPVVFDIAAGGTLALSDLGTNLVANGSFESPQIATYSGTTPTGWTCEYVEYTDNSRQGYGLQKNGCALSSDGPETPYGEQTLYLRELNRASQCISVPAAGLYRISYIQGCRTGNSYVSHTIPVSVKVNGNVVLSVPAASAYHDFERHTVDVALAADTHVIAIETGDDTTTVRGAMVFIDDVSVRRIEPLDFSNAEVRMATGSTLSLDLALPTIIPTFRVDGTVVKGRGSAIAAAGVTLLGTSENIRAGNVRGVCLSIR